MWRPSRHSAFFRNAYAEADARLQRERYCFLNSFSRIRSDGWLGLLDADGTPNNKYAEFAKDHIVWIFKNTDWIGENDTPEKGRAYVNQHIND